MKTDQPQSKGARRSILAPALAVVFVAFLLSSGMLGFALGRNAAAQSTGHLIDTIVLSPSQGKAKEPARHVLSGKLMAAPGEPCAGVTMRLSDLQKEDQTDSQGIFCFFNVEAGSHTLEVLGENGSLLAEASLSLDYTREKVSAVTEGGSTVFHVPDDLRTLEVVFTLEKDNTLSLQEGSAYFTTSSGEIVDFGNSMVKLPQDSLGVTPTGSIVTPEGYVVLLSQSAVVTPSGGVGAIEPEEEAAPDVLLKPDGSAETGSGVTIRPSGKIELPSGETVDPADRIIVVEEENTIELEELPEKYVPVVDDASAPGTQNAEAVPSPAEKDDQDGELPGETSGGTSEEASEGTPEEMLGDPPAEGPGAAEEPVLEPTPEPTPAALEFRNAETGEVLESKKGSGWEQASLVDLFRKKGKAGDDEVPVIQPGESGYYEFNLENREDYDIQYTLAFREESIHLPIRYSIVDTFNNRYYMRREKSSLDGGITSKPITIPHNSVQTYRILWEWDYEDWYKVWVDDATDTSAAKLETEEDRTYLVSLAIKAEQVIPVLGPDEDTRYPGAHPDVK